MVQRWARGLPPQRRLAAALGPLALLAAYAWPGPARDATGYPGPLGPAPDVPRRLAPLRPEGDQELACDVVVVGSGAGGGVAAAELARAGLDVVVLEKGGYLAERDFSHQEGDAYRDLYLYAMTLTTDDLACRIVAGSALGGGTVVNYSTSFATPPAVLAEWAATSGVEAFVSGEVEASLEAVAGRLGVTEDQSRPGARDQLLERGLERLGWHAGPLPRNVRGCPQDAGCGWCAFGCRVGAKQSTLVTYLEEAAAAGARLVVGADARRVLVAGGRAAGVEARTASGHRLVVRARAVVAAAGAVETPALLLRSGLGGQVGHHLRLHPGTAAMGVFDEPVRWWEGTLQARWSAQLRDRLGPVRARVRDRARAPGAGRGRPALAVGRRPPGADASGRPTCHWSGCCAATAAPAGSGSTATAAPGSAGGSTPPTRPAWPRAWPPPGRCWPPPGPARCSASTAGGSPSAPATRPPTGPGPRRPAGPGSAAAGSPWSPTTRWARAASAPTRRPRPSAPTTRPTSCPGCTWPTPRCSRRPAASTRCCR